MHTNNSLDNLQLPASLIQAAETLHHLSGLGVCIIEAATAVHLVGDKPLQQWLMTLEDNQLLASAYLNAQKQVLGDLHESAVLTLDRLISLIYIPVQLPYALLLGPYRSDTQKCLSADPVYQSLCAEERELFQRLCNKYPLKSELSLNALVKTAYALAGQQVRDVHNIHLAEVKQDAKTWTLSPQTQSGSRQARPLIPYVQEMENPNIALMIRDFVVLGNAAKAIEMFKKSTAHIAKPLSSREVHDKNEAARRIGLLYSIFYKMVECSVDHKGLIQIKDKYLEQYHRSRCTQEMDLITQDMLASFSAHAQLNQQIESYTELIQKAIVYIYDHAKRKISLKDVAAGLHVNACYLSSIFKKETGKSLTLFITEIKMEEAKRLLQNTSFPITTICYEIGFDNPSYFTEVFKKIVGVTPKEFKAAERLDVPTVIA